MACINLGMDRLALHRAAVEQDCDRSDLSGLCFLEATHYITTVGIKGLTQKNGEHQTVISFASTQFPQGLIPDKKAPQFVLMA